MRACMIDDGKIKNKEFVTFMRLLMQNFSNPEEEMKEPPKVSLLAET